MPTNNDPAIHDSPSHPPPPDLAWLDEFACEGLIVEVLARLKSGKEATVFVAEAALRAMPGLSRQNSSGPGSGAVSRSISTAASWGGASRSYSGVHSIFVRSRAPSMIRTTCTPSSTNR